MNEFIFRNCNFNENELFLRYFSGILFKSFRGLILQWKFHVFTEHLLLSLYICSNSKYGVRGLVKGTLKEFENLSVYSN